MLAQVILGLALVGVSVVALVFGVKFSIESERYRPWQELILPAFFAPILILSGIGLGILGLVTCFSPSVPAWDWSILYWVPILILFGIVSILGSLLRRAIKTPLADHTVMSKWETKK